MNHQVSFTRDEVREIVEQYAAEKLEVEYDDLYTNWAHEFNDSVTDEGFMVISWEDEVDEDDDFELTDCSVEISEEEDEDGAEAVPVRFFREHVGEKVVPTPRCPGCKSVDTKHSKDDRYYCRDCASSFSVLTPLATGIEYKGDIPF